MRIHTLATLRERPETTGMLPPGPPLPMLAQTLFWIRRPVEFLRICRKRYGGSFTVKLPPSTMVFLSEPEDIRTVFTAKPDEMHAGEVNQILSVLLGQNSVLLLDGAKHMRQRKLLLPPFHGERMRHYGRTMLDITEAVSRDWPEHAPFSLHPHTQEITLEIILRTVFGADEGAELQKLRDQMKRMLAMAEHRTMVLPMVYLSRRPQLEESQPWKFFLRNRNRTDELLYQQIAARRAERPGKARQDVLSMLIEAKDEDGVAMTDRELRDELMTALAAGHETTATALAWAMERLLATPRTYEKLKEEVRAAASDGNLDPETLSALPYLDATVKEVLRLRPVVPVVGRVLKKPFRIAGYDLPAGSTVAPCIYLAHRNPRVYRDPEEFRPERFLEDPPDPFSYLPFGGGIRRCIGAAFAQYEMKLVLGSFLARFDWELAQPAPARTIRRAITFFPELGTRVEVARIRRTSSRAA